MLILLLLRHLMKILVLELHLALFSEHPLNPYCDCIELAKRVDGRMKKKKNNTHHATVYLAWRKRAYCLWDPSQVTVYP